MRIRIQKNTVRLRISFCVEWRYFQLPTRNIRPPHAQKRLDMIQTLPKGNNNSQNTIFHLNMRKNHTLWNPGIVCTIIGSIWAWEALILRPRIQKKTARPRISRCVECRYFQLLKRKIRPSHAQKLLDVIQEFQKRKNNHQNHVFRMLNIIFHHFCVFFDNLEKIEIFKKFLIFSHF